MDHVNLLPEGLPELIFLNLNVTDLCACSLTCKKWRQFCNTNKIWLKQCKRKGWAKFGYGALDLTHLPSSDKVLNRTNVSGTSPKFEYFDGDTGLSPLVGWRMTYIKAKFIQSNWIKGHYDVLPTLRGHNSRVSAFDSNGMVFVSGSADNVAIWDLDNLVMRYRIPVHDTQVNHIQLQGHIVALSYSDGTIKVYDTISGRQIMTFHARCSAEHLRFLNKELIVCAYADKAIRVWSLKDKQLKSTMRGHTDEIECMHIRGEICVTGAWDGMLILWNIPQGEMMFALQGHCDSVMCIDMDNDYIVSGSSDETVRIWRVHTADCEHVFTDTDIKMGEVYCVAMTDDVVAAGGSNSLIQLWSREDYSRLHALKQHLGIVRTLRFNGDVLISGGDRKMICVWSAKNGVLHNIVHRNPDLLHLMWVNETKIITASPNAPGSITVISYW